VLVLDDVHELRNVTTLNFIRALAAGLPVGFHVAVGSRLRLGFGRLRSEDRCIEFGVESLAFTRQETQSVLAHTGVRLSDDALDTLLRRTEGWPDTQRQLCRPGSRCRTACHSWGQCRHHRAVQANETMALAAPHHPWRMMVLSRHHRAGQCVDETQ
jgi:hypothetical protein